MIYYVNVQCFGLTGPSWVKRNCLGLHIQRLLQKQCLPFISTETTSDTASTVILLDRANSQLQNTVLQQLPPLAMHFCQQWARVYVMLVKTCASGGNSLLLSSLLKLTTSLWSHHCLVSINIQQVPVNVNGCIFFLIEEFSSFTYTSMSDTVLSDWPPAAICHMETKCKGILAGRFNLLPYHQHPPLTSWANIIKSEALISEQPSHFPLVDIHATQFQGGKVVVGLGCCLCSCKCSVSVWWSHI